MKSIALAAALIGCTILGVVCLLLVDKMQKQDEQIQEQQTQIAELQQRVPVLPEQKETEFRWLASEIERRTSQWVPCDAQKMARVVVPVKCDLSGSRMNIVVERGDAGGQSVQTSYYDVVLVFKHEGRKWVPQWDQSTAKHENGVSPAPIEKTWWVRDLLYDAVADYVVSP